MNLMTNMPEIEGPLTKHWIVSLVAEGYNTYDIVSNYPLSEEVILESYEYLDKNVLIEGMNFSETFVKEALVLEFFTIEDLKNLSMTTYSNLSDEFIIENRDHLNWERMLILFSANSDNFDKWIEIIDEHNYWYLISANDLDIDFIRTWKDKLNWTFLSMVKSFTDEEKEEFSDYIVIPENLEVEGDFIDKSQFDFVSKMSQEELEDLIEEVNKHLSKLPPDSL